MTWEHIEGNWTSFRAKARDRWGRLSDRDLTEGTKLQLESKLQLRYGQTRDEARHEMDDFCRKCAVS